MENGNLQQRAGGPMYQQLRQELLARIRRGEFGPGDLLPSENRLCTEYGVSVTTARRAFLELVKEGMVRRKAGVGTVVAPQVRRAKLNLVSIEHVGDAWRHISSVMGEIIAGVGEYAWQHDATLNILGVQDEAAATYLRSLVEDRSTDGVLMRVANDIREEYIDILEEAGIPYVCIKRQLPGRKINCVTSDDEKGAALATSHLINLGHTRIGFVCAKPELTLSKERLTGYRRAMTEHDLTTEEGLIHQEAYFTQEMGYQAVRSLLELPSRPSAVFVASDTMALGAYKAATHLGLTIPDDVALVGYDDIVAVSTLQPPLTTVRTSFYDFGSLAAQLLLDLIDGRELPPQQRVIEPQLIVRESTKGIGQMAGDKSPNTAEDLGGSHDLSGQLRGSVIWNAAETSETQRALDRHLEAAGATVMHANHLLAESANGTVAVDLGPLREAGIPEVIVCTSRLRGDFDLIANLNRLLQSGRAAAQELEGKVNGRLILAAEVDRDPSSSAGASTAPDPAHVATRATVEQLVGKLAVELEPAETTVYGILGDSGRSEDMAALVSVLASERNALASGQTLAAKGF